MMNKAEAQPGDSVRVQVNAEPHSQVHLLAVDQSVLLLKSGNDITQAKVSLRESNITQAKVSLTESNITQTKVSLTDSNITQAKIGLTDKYHQTCKGKSYRQ